MEKVRYEEMLPHEIVARRKRFPAAFIGRVSLPARNRVRRG